MLGLADRTILAPNAYYESEKDLMKEVSIISAHLENNSVSEVMSWPSSWRRMMWDLHIERMKQRSSS
jgi:hypothetical protein